MTTDPLRRPEDLYDDGPCDRLAEGLEAWETACSLNRRTVSQETSGPGARRLRLADSSPFEPLEREAQARMSAVGEQVVRIARRLSQDVAPLGLYVRWLRRYLPDERNDHALLQQLETDLAADEARLADLLQFAAPQRTSYERVPLREVVNAAVESLAPCFESGRVRFTLDVPPSHAVTGDRPLLLHAVRNLIRNALDALVDGGDVVATSYRGADGVELEIADSGPGLHDDARRAAFDPFYSRKNAGLGLGLTVVRQIVEAHGGEVEQVNCPEGGAAFTLRFPQSARARRAAG